MIRRVRDLCLVCISGPIVVPLAIVVMLLCFVKLGRPIFYRQNRAGLQGRQFEILKFRSMTNQTDENGDPLPDALRLTTFGRFLRSTSIDELPCLWNVIKGDMSLVGPRPFIASYLPLYSDEQMRRHDVMPGITGWAQVNGRNELPWEEKFKLDLWYVENRSHWIDCKILWMTIKRVISQHGISANDEVTMPRFTGSSS